MKRNAISNSQRIGLRHDVQSVTKRSGNIMHKLCHSEKNCRMRSPVFHSIALVALFLSAPMAFADMKIYPGSICQTSSGSNGSYSWGKTINNSSTTQSYSCPLVRDSNQIRYAEVYVKDTHYDNPVSCALNTRDSRGNGIGHFVTRWSAPNNDYGKKYVGDYTLRWYGPYATRSTQQPYSMDCFLPAKYNGRASFIGNFKVWED